MSCLKLHASGVTALDSLFDSRVDNWTPFAVSTSFYTSSKVMFSFNREFGGRTSHAHGVETIVNMRITCVRDVRQRWDDFRRLGPLAALTPLPCPWKYRARAKTATTTNGTPLECRCSTVRFQVCSRIASRQVQPVNLVGPVTVQDSSSLGNADTATDHLKPDVLQRSLQAWGIQYKVAQSLRLHTWLREKHSSGARQSTATVASVDEHLEHVSGFKLPARHVGS